MDAWLWLLSSQKRTALRGGNALLSLCRLEQLASSCDENWRGQPKPNINHNRLADGQVFCGL